MTHTITGPGISATINLKGAELSSLKDHAGHEMLWQALPPWPRHAPNLFPIVGRLKHDVLRHKGRDYPMTQHGFARDRDFTLADCTESGCRFFLCDDNVTRAAYPFAFLFEVALCHPCGQYFGR